MENGLELCVVPAFAVLQARREALDACGDDAQALGIWMNVCLLARAIYRDGARAFSGGEALMRAASAEQIERWTEDYAALCREENPACSEENAQKAMQALSQEDYERLKWRVLRAFGVLPGEARARRMTDRCARAAGSGRREDSARYAARKCRRKTRDLMKGGLRS